MEKDFLEKTSIFNQLRKESEKTSGQIKLDILKNFFPNAEIKSIQFATQLRLNDKEFINCFDTGTMVVQGNTIKENEAKLKNIEEFLLNPPKVFIDYAFSNLEQMKKVRNLISSFGFEPIVLEEQVNHGQTIISKLLSCISEVSYGVVLLSPDDLVINEKTGKTYKQPRPNVLIELGMLLAHFNRNQEGKIAIVNYGVEHNDIPSDLGGVAYISFEEGKEELLAEKLQAELSHLRPEF